MQKIDDVEEWMIGQALASQPVPDMFGEMCERLRACGIPVERSLMAWATLHPLVEAEVAYWTASEGVRFEQFHHDENDTEEWLNSPLRMVIVNRETMFRSRLDQGNSEHDFPLCKQLAEEGFTDYLILATAFRMPAMDDQRAYTGIVVSWSTRQKGGFTDAQLKAINYIQKRLALAARGNVEEQIARTIAETYLGKWAGNRVLSGQIQHGDGERIRAVIFYCDMRRSTQIADVLGPEKYLAWLNDFFRATATPVLNHGGEILDFIGDAVLGIFPIDSAGFTVAVHRALKATDEVHNNIRRANDARPEGPELRAGIALSVGEVMFGNIGVSERLTFSVIGQTVHAAARLESLTKTVGSDILITEDVATHVGNRAKPAGEFLLSGFKTVQPIFELLPPSA
ncbi:adenylate/guanylate cyclase domain-containing protein [Roseibium hamelinense]|nr:adenylate/guanylate cyclase domain-containing protein [Roseibium hamelinense]